MSRWIRGGVAIAAAALAGTIVTPSAAHAGQAKSVSREGAKNVSSQEGTDSNLFSESDDIFSIKSKKIPRKYEEQAGFSSENKGFGSSTGVLKPRSSSDRRGGRARRQDLLHELLCHRRQRRVPHPLPRYKTPSGTEHYERQNRMSLLTHLGRWRRAMGGQVCFHFPKLTWA